MSDEQKILKELLVMMYQENVTQCRHHETQRATVTSSIVAIDTIIIALITFDRTLTSSDIPLTLFLILLGIFGATFTLKHYERYRMHLQRSRQYRRKLDELFANNNLEELKDKADEIHFAKHKDKTNFRHHYWWTGLHLAVTIIGITLIIIEVFFPQKAS